MENQNPFGMPPQAGASNNPAGVPSQAPANPAPVPSPMPPSPAPQMASNYPMNQNNETQSPALHFFLYLISFLALFFTATGMGAILFQFINKYFKDETLRYDYYASFSQYAIKYGIASLLIAAPVFFVLQYLIRKFLFEGKINENSVVRKWLTYIILFLAAATILGDLISLIYNMLGGDIIARFILKVLVVIFIAGVIFFYYFMEMKKRGLAGRKFVADLYFGIGGVVAIIISLVFGFMIIDSPFASRDRKIDDQTVSNLQNLKYKVENYYRDKRALPQSLSDLEIESYDSIQKDLGKYSYKKISTNSYQLCADFKRDSSEYKEDNSPYAFDLYSDNNDEWKHGKGNVCLSKDVSKIELPDLPNNHALNIYQNNGGNLVSDAQMAESRRKANIANIKSYMSSAMVSMVLCRDANGEVLSGNGGDKLCSVAVSNAPSLTWPRIYNCGANPENTKWIVKKGNSDDVDVVLNCDNITDCNNVENAVCNLKNCDFKGTCNTTDNNNSSSQWDTSATAPGLENF
jgi:hypothetical protein